MGADHASRPPTRIEQRVDTECHQHEEHGRTPGSDRSQHPRALNTAGNRPGTSEAQKGSSQPHGPRDATTEEAIGGNVFYVASGELRFPLGLPNDFGILGRAFTEVGALTDPDVSGSNLLDDKSARVSVGVGLSWRSPFGPIRIDMAQAVLKEDFDKDEIFRFSFGTRF